MYQHNVDCTEPSGMTLVDRYVYWYTDLLYKTLLQSYYSSQFKLLASRMMLWVPRWRWGSVLASQSADCVVESRRCPGGARTFPQCNYY